MLLLVHSISPQTAEFWMIYEITKKRTFYPIQSLSERLTQPLRDNLLRFHALTGCDTTLAFSGHGKLFFLRKTHFRTIYTLYKGLLIMENRYN